MTAPPAPAGQASALRKHSVTIAGHRTSLSLEDAFWQRLQAIARARGLAISALIEEIDRARADQGDRSGNLSSAIRVFVLEESARSAGG